MNKLRIMALLLAAAMMAGLALPAFAEETAEETTPETAFEIISIENADDLLALAENCRLDTWSLDKQVVLNGDISLEGVEFLPIPTFGGIFDGNGHTISGLHITDHLSAAGLFGQLQMTGVIQNLTVSGTVIPGDAQYAGGIVGENHGTILNCNFTGNLVGTDNTGGIAGVNALTGKISGCVSGGTVIGSNMTGGIAGCNLGFIALCGNKASVNPVSIDPSIAPEDISFDFLTDYSKLTSLDTGTSSMDSGGIAGYSSGIIGSCTNKAAIGYPHVGYNVGGIAGRSCGYLHDCVNTAEIFGRKDVGGIAGQMEPYIAQNLTESTLDTLQEQFEELDGLLDDALAHAGGASSSVTRRLNAMANSMDSASAAADSIETSGTISSSLSGSGGTEGSGSVTVTPPQAEAGGSASSGGGGSVEISPGSASGGHQNGASVEIQAGLTSGGVSGEAGASGAGDLDAQTQISISTNLGGIASGISGMAGQMRMLSGELGGVSGQLLEDIDRIREKISEITETGMELILGDGTGDVIVDSSELDVDLITLGKLSGCTNSGAVNGDLNVGGIAGDMGLEYTLDPEDDVTVSVEGTARRKYEVKAVIQNCENTGTVTAKRNYAGGIAGRMDLGLIAQCGSYGNVSSDGGSYVGGIAGIGGSTIRHCFSKCSLSGGKYIGGIVGSGVESDRNGDSSTVAACYAIVTIPEYKQYAGAISGTYAGVFLENYFVSEDLAGIDRISYAGCAEPMEYDALIAHFSRSVETEPAEETSDGVETASEETEPVAPPMDLPEEFQKFTLKFVIDGQVVDSRVFDYGASFGPEVFPEIPQKSGYYGYWDRDSLENLTFDTTVTAVYDPYITALESADVRNGDQPVFFVEGDFGEGDVLQVQSQALNSHAFDLPEGLWDGLVTSLREMELNTEVVEQWQLSIPGDELTEYTVRYLPPHGDKEQMDVYILRSGEWVRIETEVVGSYVTFPAEGGDVELAIVSTRWTGWVWGIVAALAVLLLVLIVWLVRKYAKPRTVEVTEKPEKMGLRDRISGKPWMMVLAVILALLVGIGGTAAFFLLPDLMTGLGAYEVLRDHAERDTLHMELQAEVTIGSTSCPVDAELDRLTLDGTRVTVIREAGNALYYSGGTVFLENGDAYRISTDVPDHSQLLERTMALYQNMEVEERNGTYTINVDGSDARTILELLMPAAAEELPDGDALEIRVVTEEDVLKKIEFTGSGRLKDDDGTAYSVRAVLRVMEGGSDVQIPESVAEEITSGEYETVATLSDELYRLARGWQALNAADPLAAELELYADCGPLALDESVMFYRWPVDGDPIFALEDNGYTLYYRDGMICDGRGNAIPTAGGANTGAAELLEFAYTVCMNGDVERTDEGGQAVYTLSLDREGMEKAAYSIAPEAAKLDVRFDSGLLRVTIRDDRIESVAVEVCGNVQIALTGADVSIGAKLEFQEEDGAVSLPEAVREALDK